MPNQPDGSKPYFYEITKELPPSVFVTQSIDLALGRERALDIGCGAGRNSIALFNAGFSKVIGVDLDPQAGQLLKEIDSPRLVFLQQRIEDVELLPITYDLVNGSYSLPFIPKQHFEIIIQRIKDALKVGGIFTGQFFGVNHEWTAQYPNINFHTREQAEKLLEGMEAIKFIERDHDSKRADGIPTHWHVFHFIARKVF